MTTFYEQIHKKNTFVDEEENRISRENMDKWIFSFLLVLIGLLPLIVLGHVEQVISPLISTVAVLSSGEKGELFTHYKYLLLVTFTVIILSMFLIKIYFMEAKIRKTFVNYVLSVFLIAIVVSTFFSPNITIALFGYYSRSDGAISWICYIILMFIAMNINYPKNFVSKIMYTLMPVVYINLFIITMNFIGKDLVQNTIIQSILFSTLPEGATLGNNSVLVGTLNQWNYMSGMFAMMTVMYLAWAITTKKWWEALIGTITAAASVSIMFMSTSTSGFLTVVVSAFFLLILLINVENKKAALLSLLAFIIIVAPIFHILAQKNDNVWKESFGFIINSNPYEKSNISLNSLNGNLVHASNSTFTLPELPRAGWSAGSGRLYIWDKTIELVKERPIIGYGMDTLIYNFPHYNIDARAGNYNEKILVDKPHNMYLGVLYGTGIVGGLAFLLIILYTTKFALQSVISKKHLQIAPLGLIVLAFYIQAMFNDSLPGISGVAFVLIGVLVGIIKNEQQDSELG